MNFILFLAKMIFVSGMLYCYYRFFLRNNKFHLYNRYFLLLIPFLSILIPLVKIPIPNFYASGSGTGIRLLKAVTVSDWEETVVITAKRGWTQSMLSWQNAAIVLYIIIAMVLSYFLLRSILQVIRLGRKYEPEIIEGIKFYQTQEPGTPFSFLKNIFWNEKINMNSAAGKQILRHELYHVEQKHTTDILYIESLQVLFWFNPFFYLLKKELKAVHEFLADQYAASDGNRSEYAEMLLWESIANHKFNMGNPFFNNQIKRRITMITQTKNPRFGYIRRIMALPLLFLMLCAFGVKLEQQMTSSNPFHFKKPITVVIDAGHGGIDAGTRNSDGILEKDMNLSISKKIEELSKEYNVNVIMTREKDILPGNANNIQDGLQNRIDIATSKNADLFISIHMDANVGNQQNDKGFSIYYSNSNPYSQKCVLLGSALAEEIKKSYAVSPELKQREKGIKVLQSTAMPSVLIECGYITNKEDLAFMSNSKNQEKIARDILEGVVKYSNSNNSSLIYNKDTIPATNKYKSKNDLVITDVQLTKDTEAESLSKTQETTNGNEMLVSDVQISGPNGNSSLSDTIIKENTPIQVFTKVEVEAEYPGGQEGWSKYLNANFKYPPEAIKKNIQGTVIAKFIVGMDGKVSHVEITKSPDKILSDATVDIINKSGDWIAATQNGHKVNCYKIQPIVFRLAK